MHIKEIDVSPEGIIQETQENGISYFDLPEEERKYFTKCVGVIDETPFVIINDLHKAVTKVVKYLSTRREDMLQILDERIVDVILQRPGPISPLQRYDLLYDKNGELKVVEVNSETPAGLPEASNSFLFDRFVDGRYENINNDILRLLKKKDKTVAVLFADDGSEDLTNATYLGALYSDDSCIVNAEDLVFDEEGYPSAYGKEVLAIHSFYPLERIFQDGGEQFWKSYVDCKFDLVNGPINLISQSKAFWAWIFENLDRLVDEKVIESSYIFERHVPKYYFTKQPNTISKPRLFREGVGIGEVTEGNVFQEYIEQMEFDVETFEGKKTGYITLGIYCDEESGVGTYCRFCESKITDYTSYYLPIYFNILFQDEKTLSPIELANSVHPYLMHGN